MPSVCSAKFCKNRGGHFFPKDPVLAKKWLTAIGRPGFLPSKHSRLCSAHFRESDFIAEGFYTGLPLTKKYLKKDAVPTVFSSKGAGQEPLGSSIQYASKREVRQARPSKPGKRKLVEPITKLCMKSSKAILLIQDPHYGQYTTEVEGAFDSDCEAVHIKIKPDEEPIRWFSDAEPDEESDNETEREISVERQVESSSGQKNERLDVVHSVFEYDVTSRPSLREVSSKSPGANDRDDQQNRVYTSEQRDDVIDKLNAARSDENVRKLLGPKLTKSIETYLHANGSFSKLDELLEVPSLGPKTVRTVCDRLLGIIVDKPPRSRSTSPTSSSSSPGRRTRSPAHVVSPPLTEEFCLSVNLLGAAVVDVTSISWALVDSKKKTLLDWKSVPIDVPLTSLRDVVVKATVIEKELPEADLFVLEDTSVGSRGSHHLKSHFTCALATSIHVHREATAGVVKMAFIKNRLVEKHFNATVGSETVSLQPFLQDIMDQKVAVGRSNLFISQDLVKYYKGLEPVAREQLSRAGLLSVTCMDLVLDKRDALDKRKITESTV